MKAILAVVLLAVSVNANCSLCEDGKIIGDSDKDLSSNIAGYTCGTLNDEVVDIEDSKCDEYWANFTVNGSNIATLQADCECADGAMAAGLSLCGFAAAALMGFFAL